MTTTLKTCFKCGQKKAFSEFYGHSQMGDGKLGKCKECTKADVRANYRARRTQYREYERARATLPHRVTARKKYARTDAGKAAHAKALKVYASKFPDRYRARIAFGNALRDGRVNPLPCFVCGEKAQAHHPDYSAPLDVVWLCRFHHKQAHALVRKAA